MRVLVTGGAGYIGSHAIRALRAQSFEPVIFDNLSTGFRQLAEGFPLIEGDIRDYGAVRKALEGVEAIMHFAAHTYVGESVTNPRKYYDNNVFGTINLLNAAVDSGIKKFIFSSTCATYGIPDRVPIVESTPQKPINPYGATKLAIEQALNAYDPAYGLKFVSLRYFNAAGAHEDGSAGELHEPETHVIPLILRVAAGLAPYIETFGDDYPTPDGTCIRDYIHVMDLADAHVLALKHLIAGAPSKFINLGTGTGYSVAEVIAMAEKVTGREIKTRVGPRRPGDPPALVASNAYANETIGWQPRLGLEEVLTTAWKWTQQQQ